MVRSFPEAVWGPSFLVTAPADHRALLSCCFKAMKTHVPWFRGWQCPGIQHCAYLHFILRF